MENSSEIVLVLQGFNETRTNKEIFFVLGFFAYVFTIFVNLTLLATIVLEKKYHEPMFMFLCNLCINGIFGASSFYPKLLIDLLSDMHVISYNACMTQISAIYTYAFCEFTALTVMAYDRYVAICKPLSYHSIMTPRKVTNLLILIWLFSLCESVIGTNLTARLPLCGLSINKLFCTNWTVVKLSCVDTTINNVYGYILMFSHVSQAVLILVSYVNIIKSSVRSLEERNKFMQTCLPHLITLINFTTAVVFDSMYSRYGSSSHHLALRNFMSLQFLVVPPLLNPLIYGIKMNQIRRKIFTIFRRKISALK